MSPIDESIIKKLKDALPHLEIVTPDSPDYEKSLKRFNPSSERRAGMVIFPTSAKDVSVILVFSQENALDIAFRCGGHSQRGASSSDGGICVDLSKLIDISIDTETKEVTIGGGAIWERVGEALDKDGIGVVMGVCSNVGVGGFTLIGGYGWLTGAHGYGTDNLLKAEVVLADARIVTASETENSDLLWALRGAGPSFGVVTSMTLQGYTQGQVWAGEMVFPRTALPAIVEVANKIYKSDGEAGMVFSYRSLPTGGSTMLVCDVFYNSPDEAKAKEFFAPMVSASPVSDETAIKPFSKAGDSPPDMGKAHVWTGGSVMAPMDVAFMDGLLDDYDEFVNRLPDAASSIMFCEVHSFHGPLKRGPRETAFANRGTWWNLAPVTIRQTAEKGEEESREWTEYMHDKLHKELEKRKEEKIREGGIDECTKTGVGDYINYDGLGQSPKMLYGVNYERLVELKKKFDPNNVFWKMVNLHEG